jgi:hypothetical protein
MISSFEKQQGDIPEGEVRNYDIASLTRFYNMFFGAGTGGLLIMLGLVIYIMKKKHHRSNPMGIIIHLLFT